MATTISSTSLDINSIKQNLKDSLRNSGEFGDFDFDASGLSSILDVLAYNTHYNGLTANFALNESFLSTAQLRSSILSLAEGIGYVADSRTSSQAIVNLSINVPNGPSKIQINEFFKFNTSIDEIDFVFQTREDLNAIDDGTGVYTFTDIAGNENIKLYEGIQRTKTFIALTSTDNPVYVVPDRNLDLSTAVVRVYETPSSSSFVTYSNLQSARTINENSTLYILREAPNGFFELSFGNGVTDVPFSGTIRFKLNVVGANQFLISKRNDPLDREWQVVYQTTNNAISIVLFDWESFILSAVNIFIFIWKR